MPGALLLIDPITARRGAVSEGLAAQSYEVVLASALPEGLRLAEAIRPEVVVVAGLGDPGMLAEQFGTFRRAAEQALVFLGEDSTEALEVPDEVLFLATQGLGYSDIVRHLRLVLVGRDVGVEPDLELGSLVGELSLFPILELVRTLHRSAVSGRLEVPGGVIRLSQGEVVVVRAGKVQGMKAFCRLGQLHEGPFRIVLEPPAGRQEMSVPVDDLVLAVVEEAQFTLPDPQLTIKVLGFNRSMPSGPGYNQRQLLELIARYTTVGELFDALPGVDSKIWIALQRLMEARVVVLQKPLPTVKIVTDSTADLPPELVRAHDIRVVPLSIVFGKDAFRDGVDMKPRDFYQLLESSEVHPGTLPPAQGEFYEHYLDIIEKQDIVSVHISGRLSETAANARQAAAQGRQSFHSLPPERRGFTLQVVDSRTVSIATGLLALFAARMAQRGHQALAISALVQALVPRIEVLFVVNTLDFLVRGGRVGKAQALVGKLLGIKPILGVVDGEVAAVDRARGGRKAQQRIVELLMQRFDRARPVVAAVAHARAPAWAERLRGLLGSTFELREEIVTDIGPVVGTHAGPGCVGCVVVQPTDAEWELVGPLSG